MSVQRPLGLVMFHRSGIMECPYLDAQQEQQLFTELPANNAQPLFDRLSHAGFRRSHQVIYRPTCPHCNACKSARIVADEFDWRKSWRRIMKRNADLTMTDVGLKVSREQYDLFSEYVQSRHGDGEMADMSERDYLNLVLASPVKSTIFEFRTAEDELKAVCLVDYISDGLSAVYSFFNPEDESRSLGSYMILQLIEWAKAHALPYIYLGFWVDGSHKMAYKDRFKPLEIFDSGGWTRLP